MVQSKSLELQKELENQIRSNRSLIYLQSHEEGRLDDAIQNIACDKSKPWTFIFWDIASGCKSNSSLKLPNSPDQLEILNWFLGLLVDRDDFCILVLHDFYKFLAPDGHPGQVEIQTIRSLKNLIEKCNNERKCVILTGAKYFIPAEFEKIVLLMDWSLPEPELILEKINSLIKSAKKKPDLKNFKTDYTDDELGAITRAFQGLSLKEIEMICTYFMLTEKELDPAKIASKKQYAIKKSGILDWVNTDINLAKVGGLSNLKNWLYKRKDSFTEKAAHYNLPYPKGLLIIGIQGGGKSQASKAIASFWSLPLLRLDMGKVFSGIVGSSEENLRSVIKVAESVAPCIVWLDEIEKVFSNNSFSSDSGTSSRIFGTFLNWMQEKEAPVFIVGTANDVSKLPPELIRKGRFDDIFFVDLPDADERKEIWEIHLEQRNLDPMKFDITQLSNESDGFTGAEIEAAIISSMYEGFSDHQREINTVDIIRELKESIPISVTMKEEISNLREWASKRARSASKTKYLQEKIDKDEEL
jgi:SpoVK/Ycf46/Vps4 family AAA+-type ATPase